MPRTPSAEAEPNYEDASAVDVVILHHTIEQRHHGLVGNRVGPRLRRTIRRDDDGLQAVETRADHLLHEGTAVIRHPFAAWMQRQDERPRVLRVVAARNRNRVRHWTTTGDRKYGSMDAGRGGLQKSEDGCQERQDHHSG